MIRLGARSGAEYLRAMSVSIKGVPPATSGDSSNGPTGPSDSLDPAVRTVSGWLNGLIGDAQRRAETILVVAAALLAWIFRFVQDDAFITYRYAWNMARGNGLVFNPGDHVEGYTNFLWTVIHVIPEKAGWDTPLFSQLLGIVLMVATVMVVLRMARILFASEGFAMLVGIVVVANMTFLVYATGGLETMLQALTLSGSALALLPALSRRELPSIWRSLAAGALAGLAILTRLDSVVYLVPLFVAACVRLWNAKPRAGEPSARLGSIAAVLAVAAVPALVLVVPWFVWKLSYYGELLPNTFQAKSASNPLAPILFGVFYLATYFFLYGAFLLIKRFRRYRRSFFDVPGTAALFSVVGVWLLYTVYVGADFMEYRFLVVITPILAMLGAWLIDRFTNLRSQLVLMSVLMAFSLLHLVIVFPAYPVLSFRSLEEWPAPSRTARMNLGQILNDAFPGGPEVPGQPVIAVGPLGAISYYSDLESVDMLGLTDEWVARNGEEAQIYYPGHVRMAPPEYLADRGVDLIIGQPLPTSEHLERDGYRLSELVPTYSAVDLRDLPEGAVVLGVPVPAQDGAADLVWPVIYLADNPRVDEVAEAEGWVTQPIIRECDPADFADPVARRLGSRTC